MNSFDITTLPLGPYDTNCYILVDAQTRESIIVDAPADPAAIVAAARGTTVKYIVITHSHGDHTGALPEVRSQIKAPVLAHPLDAPAITLDTEINDRDILMFGTTSLTMLHTPGHTPGSICLLTGKHLFSGDTLFPDGPGHTSTPRDFNRIVQSITEKLFVLPDDTQVHPGHGASTVLGKEKNAFARFSSRNHRPDLCGDVLWVDQR